VGLQVHRSLLFQPFCSEPMSKTSLSLLLALLTGQATATTIPTIDTSNSSSGIVPFSALQQTRLRIRADRYTKITSPNGNTIHFLAQSPTSDQELIDVRRMSESLLAPYPEVFDHLATQSPTVFLFPSANSTTAALPGLNQLETPYVTLRSDLPKEGDLFSFFYKQSFKETLPSKDLALDSAARSAQGNGSAIWTLDQATLDDFVANGQLSTEYIKRLTNSFYNQSTSDYLPKTRTELEQQDTLGYQIVSSLLPRFFPHAGAADVTLTSWRQDNFGIAATATSTMALQATLWGNSADPDQDGRVNLVEYMEMTNPKQRDEAETSISRNESGKLELTISFRKGSTGFRPAPTATLDLQSWSTLFPESWNFSSLQDESLTLEFDSSRSQQFFRINYLPN